MDIKDKLKDLIKNSLTSYDLDIDINDITIEIPKDKEHGDYSTNVAMKYAKKLAKNPLELANELKDKIESKDIDKIEVKGTGFINFFVNKNYLFDNILTILKEKDDYGRSNIGNKQKVNIEFVSVNPTGKIHLGHTRGACYGSSLANIYEFAGFIPTKEYYINDAGNQMDNMALSIKERYKQICGLDYKLEEDYYHGKEIIDVAQILYDEAKDNYLNKELSFFKERGLDIFLTNIREDLKSLGVVFDIYTSEQSLRDNGKVEECIAKLDKLGYTYDLEGATFLKTTLFGDEKDRVIIKKDGSYTYFLPDIAYHLDKVQRGYDHLIDVLGADHHGYVSRLKASVQMFGNDKDILDVKIIQMVRAIKDNKEYKLSKRTGNTITLEDLVEAVGKDAVRYFFTSRSIDTQMDFDIDLALSTTNDNPVYYVNYAHARICSILNNNDIDLEGITKFETISSEEAYNVLAKLYNFGEVVKKSALRKEPHLITNYVYDLAVAFHSYYGKEKIVTEELEYTKERLALIKAVKITIANALRLIGIEAKEKM